MSADLSRRTLWTVLAVALALALTLTAAGSAMQPAPTVADAGGVVGHAAFAYLGGLRTFAAAVLWNRLEPQLHGYYDNKTMDQMTFALPTIRLVTMLDPQFQDAYYVGAWVVFRHGDRAEGLRVARDGLAQNPNAGLMYANVVNILLSDGLAAGDKNLHEAEQVKLAEAGLAPGVQWNSESDRFEGYAVFADTLRLAGRTGQADAVRAELKRMRDTGLVPNMERELQEKGN